MLLASFRERFVRTLIPEPFRQLARQTGWSRRQGKIDPFEFLSSLIFGQMSASRLTLSSQAQSLTEPVTRQGIDQRFNPAAVEFFQAAYARIMAETLDWSAAHPPSRVLAPPL